MVAGVLLICRGRFGIDNELINRDDLCTVVWFAVLLFIAVAGLQFSE